MSLPSRLHVVAVVVVALLSGCFGAQPGNPTATETSGPTGSGHADNPPPPRVQEPANSIILPGNVTAWPAADALFLSDSRWLGGDGLQSMSLTDGRILWLLHDSFIARSDARSRSESTIIRNAVAVQDRPGPSDAHVKFYWKEDITQGLREDLPYPFNAEPTAFFPAPSQTPCLPHPVSTAMPPCEWYWPSKAVLLDGRLLVFLLREQATSDGLGFKAAGVDVAIITNPSAAPDEWQWSVVATPRDSEAVAYGEGEVIVTNGWLYAYGSDPQGGGMRLGRWPASAAAQGDFSGLERWCGETWGPSCPALPLFDQAAGGFSIALKGGDGWVLVQTTGFGNASLALRSAQRLEGPWSDMSVVYLPPEAAEPGALVYAAHFHVGFGAGQWTASYVVNNQDFGKLVADQTIYFPRFVRWEP